MRLAALSGLSFLPRPPPKSGSRSSLSLYLSAFRIILSLSLDGMGMAARRCAISRTSFDSKLRMFSCSACLRLSSFVSRSRRSFSTSCTTSSRFCCSPSTADFKLFTLISTSDTNFSWWFRWTTTSLNNPVSIWSSSSSSASLGLRNAQ